MSSKFSRSARAGQTPSWCIPPPPPPPVPILPGGWIHLNCYGCWADHDPADYKHLSESFTLQAITLGFDYAGSSTFELPKLVVSVERPAIGALWLIKMTYLVTDGVSEHFEWEPVAETNADPLLIHPPMDILIPGHDYRNVYVYG